LILTPRYFGFESRPFFVDPAAFLWAMVGDLLVKSGLENESGLILNTIGKDSLSYFAGINKVNFSRFIFAL
jgi:hypothetical protein